MAKLSPWITKTGDIPDFEEQVGDPRDHHRPTHQRTQLPGAGCRGVDRRMLWLLQVQTVDSYDFCLPPVSWLMQRRDDVTDSHDFDHGQLEVDSCHDDLAKGGDACDAEVCPS